MERVSGHSGGVIFKIAGTLVGIFFFTSCAFFKFPDSTQLGKSQDEVAGVQSSQPLPQKQEKLAIILGPGGYKTFVYVGVLKRLIESGIVIDSVAGVEWGALMAALYAQNARIHEMEWKSFKLGRLNFQGGGTLSRLLKNNFNAMEKFLKQNLSVKSLSQFRVKFLCSTLSVKTQRVKVLAKGDSQRAVSRCLSSLPIFSPYEGQWVAHMNSLRELREAVRLQGADRVLVLSALDSFQILPEEKGSALGVYWMGVKSYWSHEAGGAMPWFVIQNTSDITSAKDVMALVKQGYKEGERIVNFLRTHYGM